MAKKTHEQFTSEIIDKFGDIYKFHSEYNSSSEKLEVEHIICGYRWNPLSANLLQGKSKCPQCSGKAKYTTETFNEWLENKSDGEFSLTSEYKWNKEKIKIQHNTCGHERWVFPFYLFREKFGCPKCNNMLVHNKERVELLVEDKYGTEYSLISEDVKNNRDSIIFRHNICNKEFETSSNRLINNGIGCSYCKPIGSNGELKIEKYLKQNKIKFIREYSFDDCRHKSALFFDFAIFDSMNSLIGLIEFDGKQHFEPVEFFGGVKGFESTQLRDGIKDAYCLTNNIPLLRIPYWDEENIEFILTNKSEGVKHFA